MKSKDDLVSIEEGLLYVVEMLKRETGTPQDIYYPGYGQILKDGVPTESGLKWFKDNIDRLRVN